MGRAVARRSDLSARRRMSAAAMWPRSRERHERARAPLAGLRRRMAQAHARCRHDSSVQGATHRDFRRSGFSRDRARSDHAKAGRADEKPTRHTGNRRHRPVKPPARPPARGPASGLKSLPHGTQRRAIRRMRHATNPGTALRWQRGTGPRSTQAAAPARTSRQQALTMARWQAPSSGHDQGAKHGTIDVDRAGAPPSWLARRGDAGFSPPTPAHCGTCAATATRPATRPDAS